MAWEVPVDDALPDQREESVDDLLQDVDGLGLGGVRSDFQIFFEVGVAELLDDVVIVGAFHHLVDRHDVFGLDLLEDLYFLQEGVFEVLI